MNTLEKKRTRDRLSYWEDRDRRLANANSYYQRNADQVKQKQILKRKQAKLLYMGWLGTKCERCGFDNIAALQFHHRKPETKKFAIADAISHPYKYTIEEIKQEVKKCELICANCHSIEHFFR